VNSCCHGSEPRTWVSGVFQLLDRRIPVSHSQVEFQNDIPIDKTRSRPLL
jgi:hypothetical protein